MLQGLVETGYESEYFVLNAGSMLLFFLILLILFVALAVCLPCITFCNCCRKLHAKLKSWLMYNPVLRLALESSLDLSFAILINYRLNRE